ncbi:MAG: transporter substrate-binding domain-containing protein [Pseudomonadota bacterium]|nr:transporter substrate-binding domain-containing protein [Pseudomonadota bacterium]
MNMLSRHLSRFPRPFPPALCRSVTGWLATGLMLAAGPAFADEHASKTLASTGIDASTFVFNVSPNGYPPYMIVEGDQESGIMLDVLERIAPRIGYQVETRKIPRKRVDQMLLEDYIDGTPRAIEWTQEPEQFLFTDPIVQVEEVFFFPEGSTLDYRSPRDLFGKTLVTHLGYQYPALEPHLSAGDITRFDVSRDEDMFRYLMHGDRFHAAVADRLVGKWILRNQSAAGSFRTSSSAISEYGFRIMVRPEAAGFVEAFNRELKKLRDSGELDTILADYR